MNPIKRIGIVGPESTGKSDLAAALATHFRCQFVKEVARDYLPQLGRPYGEEDLTSIARLQVAEEEQVLAAHPPLLLCDTTLLVIRIWSAYKYGRIASEITALDQQRRYDLYLLTDIDLPWEEDPLREHPGERPALFSMYYRTLLQQPVPFSLIRGTGNERVQQALRAIQPVYPGVAGNR